MSTAFKTVLLHELYYFTHYQFQFSGLIFAHTTIASYPSDSNQRHTTETGSRHNSLVPFVRMWNGIYYLHIIHGTWLKCRQHQKIKPVEIHDPTLRTYLHKTHCSISIQTETLYPLTKTYSSMLQEVYIYSCFSSPYVSVDGAVHIEKSNPEIQILL